MTPHDLGQHTCKLLSSTFHLEVQKWAFFFGEGEPLHEACRLALPPHCGTHMRPARASGVWAAGCQSSRLQGCSAACCRAGNRHRPEADRHQRSKRPGAQGLWPLCALFQVPCDCTCYLVLLLCSLLFSPSLNHFQDGLGLHRGAQGPHFCGAGTGRGATCLNGTLAEGASACPPGACLGDPA